MNVPCATVQQQKRRKALKSGAVSLRDGGVLSEKVRIAVLRSLFEVANGGSRDLVGFDAGVYNFLEIDLKRGVMRGFVNGQLDTTWNLFSDTKKVLQVALA